jgi:hypothetical protein
MISRMSRSRFSKVSSNQRQNHSMLLARAGSACAAHLLYIYFAPARFSQQGFVTIITIIRGFKIALLVHKKSPRFLSRRRESTRNEREDPAMMIAASSRVYLLCIMCMHVAKREAKTDAIFSVQIVKITQRNYRLLRTLTNKWEACELSHYQVHESEQCNSAIQSQSAINSNPFCLK